jgi:hypothetical protein
MWEIIGVASALAAFVCFLCMAYAAGVSRGERKATGRRP